MEARPLFGTATSRIGKTVVPLLLVALCGACAASTPPLQTSDDLIGEWTAPKNEHSAILRFDEDGTVRLEHVPRAAVTSDPSQPEPVELDRNDTVDLDGEWRFFDPTGTRDSGSVSVILHVDDPRDDFSVNLRASGPGLCLQYGNLDDGQCLPFVHASDADVSGP